MLWRAMILVPILGTIALLNSGGSQWAGYAKTGPTQEVSEPQPGQLTILQKDGTAGALCPLSRTSVQADVAGFGARVAVHQLFTNPTKETIEAVYTFPLPNNAAVDHMTMKIGDRIIEGTIKERGEARRIYETAKNQGQTAALLDQERPNIFTQSVANITPGAQVEIEIDYVQTLKFQDGTYEFNFPMVVGPRFLGNAADPDKIAPPITPKGTRTGANIDLTVNIDAGAPIQAVHSVLHEINTQEIDANHCRVTLKREDEIPNRDFILKYQVSADKVTDAFVSNMDTEKGGFFALALLPPKDITPQDITPREFIFVMDQSGSQSGFPIEKSKELTLKLIDTLRPMDTFNVIGFNNTVQKLWPQPRANTPENIQAARQFVSGMDANGGTQLREGLIASLENQKDPRRLRMIVFNTDGFVGDENLILDTLQKTRQNARVFTFGIGNGVNRYLIDTMSYEGRGAAEYVTLAEQADGAAQRFIKRTRTPVLTDISVKVDGASVSDVEPAYVPDVYDQTPVYVFGRYQTPGKAKITISGNHGGQPWTKTIDVNLGFTGKHPQIMSLWARDRVDSLSRESFASQYNGEGKDLRSAITDLGLQFRLMTQYTSFVAVEDRIVNVGGKQHTVRVPVEMTDGVSYEGVGQGGVMAKSVNGMMAGRSAGGGAAGFVPQGIDVVSFDPTDNSLFAAPQGGGTLRGGYAPDRGILNETHGHTVNGPTKDQLLKKIDKKLQTAKGNVAVEVWLQSITPEILKALAEKGLKVEEKDDKLRIVFATCDAAKLLDIAAIPQVQRIEPLDAGK